MLASDVRSPAKPAAVIRLALGMIFHSRSQFLLTTIGIGVAFFLAAAMLGLLVGWCHTTSAIIRHADADLWLMAENTPAFDYGTSIPGQRVYQARSIAGVSKAEAIFVGWNYLQTPDGRDVNTLVVGLDDSCLGAPWRMSAGTPEVVFRPSAVIVDELFLEKLGVADIGQEVEIQSKRAIVQGISQEVRSFTASPYVFTSLETARAYDQRYLTDEVTYVVAQCVPGADVERTCERLRVEIPDVEVLTTDQFAWRTTRYWMLETGAGITVVITALLGLLVGLVITSQTMFSMTQNHLGEYATLIALGFRRSHLSATIALQACLLGASGLILGCGTFFVIMHVSADSPAPVETTPAVFGGLVLLTFVACLSASLISVRSIFRIDPVLVFHN